MCSSYAGRLCSEKIYNENPLEVAKSFEDAGIQRLHLVDLDGAKQKRIVNHKVLELLATKTNLHIDFGGGVQSDEMIEIAFNSGAKQVTGGSVAVKNPELFEGWLQSYGGEKSFSERMLVMKNSHFWLGGSYHYFGL